MSKLYALATLIAFFSLVNGCATRVSPPAAIPMDGSSNRIFFFPAGPATNIAAPATLPDAQYRILTDDQGLLRLMGILPKAP